MLDLIKSNILYITYVWDPLIIYLTLVQLQSLVSPDSPLKPTISHYTSALSHWSEATERHNEQIRMVLTEPLSEFLANDFRWF